MVGANNIDDSLVAKEAKGSGWRIGKKKEILRAREKNMKKITKLSREAEGYREVGEAGREKDWRKSF